MVVLKMAHNGGDWRSKSLVPMLMVSTTLDGFYFANCVLAAVFFLFDFQNFRKQFENIFEIVCIFKIRLYICIIKTK
jgi:hypothetical protein